MSPSALTIEVCSGPNDGETAHSDTGSLSIGSRGAADLPLAGEPDVPGMVTLTLAGADGAYTLGADAEFKHGGSATRSLDGVSLPVMIAIGGVDLCVSAVEGTGTLPPPPADAAAAGGTDTHGETPAPTSDEGSKPLFGPDIPPPPPPSAAPPAAAPAGDAAEATPGEVGPLCPDCGLVNAPGATRCERCRRWLD